MSLRLHILSDRPTNQNTQAFLVPLLLNTDNLSAHGIEIQCFYDIEPAIYECDVLAINNKVWPGNFEDHRNHTLQKLETFAERIKTILYFDRSSSPAHIIPDVLPRVTKYLKTSLLRDRTRYLTPPYGGRLFADFYHRSKKIDDEVPWRYQAVIDEKHLTKLHVSWNTAFGNYSLIGPRLTSFYARCPNPIFLSAPRFYHPPEAARPIDVSCRMSMKYSHNTVAFQRREIARILADFRRTDRVSKIAYVRELKKSKVVASPFGYSEINYKDFETFMYGALLLKPDMSHLETYPDLYRDEETFVAHSWALDDVREKIDRVLSDRNWRLQISSRGQELYRWYVTTQEGQEHFVDRFVAHLEDRP